MTVSQHDEHKRSVTKAFQAHWEELCAYVSRKFGGGPPDPEDVVQEAFARFSSLSAPQSIENPRAFLYTTTRNIVIDHKRRDVRLESYIEAVLHRSGQDLPDKLSLENHMIQSQQVEIVQKVIDRMPSMQRKVLLLNRLDGLSYTKIEASTDWSTSQIGRQITKAMLAISRALNDTEAGEGL